MCYRCNVTGNIMCYSCDGTENVCVIAVMGQRTYVL